MSADELIQRIRDRTVEAALELALIANLPPSQILLQLVANSMREEGVLTQAEHIGEIHIKVGPRQDYLDPDAQTFLPVSVHRDL